MVVGRALWLVGHPHLLSTLKASVENKSLTHSATQNTGKDSYIASFKLRLKISISKIPQTQSHPASGKATRTVTEL